MDRSIIAALVRSPRAHRPASSLQSSTPWLRSSHSY
jgi:hypothetical protein